MVTSVLQDQQHMTGVTSLLGWQKFARDTKVQAAVRQWLGQQPALFFLQKACRNLFIEV